MEIYGDIFVKISYSGREMRLLCVFTSTWQMERMNRISNLSCRQRNHVLSLILMGVSGIYHANGIS